MHHFVADGARWSRTEVLFEVKTKRLFLPLTLDAGGARSKIEGFLGAEIRTTYLLAEHEFGRSLFLLLAAHVRCCW